jgi:hypothetical protein
MEMRRGTAFATYMANVVYLRFYINRDAPICDARQLPRRSSSLAQFNS